jgi:hypothetical protein
LTPVIPGFWRSGCQVPAPPWVMITGFCIDVARVLCELSGAVSVFGQIKVSAG